jgi:hypothetical protein
MRVSHLNEFSLHKPVICEECEKEGKKSTVSVNRSMVGCLVLHQPHEFYDEEGRHHYHANPCNYGPSKSTYEC